MIAYNKVKIPDLILGTYKHNQYSLLKNIVLSSIENGITGFDTAPSYGTEKILGKIIHECLNKLQKSRKDLFISTKIDAFQMQDSNGNVECYVDKVLKEMKLDYIDQLLIHWPITEYFNKTWESFIRIYKSGQAKVIGVCNVRKRHILKLMNSELFPMVVQNERHPIYIDQMTLEFCKKNKIIYEAYSPVGQMMKRIDNSNTLQKLALKYDRSIGQIIIRWHIDTGSIPVFMTSKKERLKEYSSVFNFSLNTEDIASIDALNENYKIFLESEGCPNF